MSQRPNDFFIAGTDTEIGKTFITAALLRAFGKNGLRTIGMKPVAAGADLIEGVWRNDDVEFLKSAANVDAPQPLLVPYLMKIPAAPHIVAALENVHIDLQEITRCYQQMQHLCDVVLVEGVGGFCVPLGREISTVDMAKALNLPVILVVGMRLGCINHALLTAQAIAASGLRLAAWVANTVDQEMRFFEENVQALQMRLQAPCLGVMPYLDEQNGQSAVNYLDLSLLK